MVSITNTPVQVGDSFSTKYDGQATPTATDFIFPSVQDSIIVTNYGFSYITAISGGESVRVQPNGGIYRFKNDSDKVNIQSSSGSTGYIGIEGRSHDAGQVSAAGTKKVRKTWDSAEYPIILGHRGTSIAAPENTIASYDYAYHGGADGLENDVISSVDGELFLMHDDTFNRTTDLTGSALNARHELFTQADAGIKFQSGSIFGKQQIPSLAQWFDRYGDKTLLLCEPKAYPNTTGVATKMAQMIVERGMQESIVVQSFGTGHLTAVKAVDSSIKTVMLSNTLPDLSLATSLGCWGISIYSSVLTQVFIGQAKALGLKVFVFTIDTVKQAEDFIAMGADGVITNDPIYLKNMIGKNISLPYTYMMPKKFVGSGLKTMGNVPTITTNGLGWSLLATDLWTSGVGLGIRTPNADYKISVPIKVNTANTDTSRHFGIYLESDRDDIQASWANPSPQNAMSVAYRGRGDVEITTSHTTANYVPVSNSGWPVLATGDAFTLEISVTSTTITVKRSDNVKTFSSANNKGRSGWMGIYTASESVSFGDITITTLP